MMNYLELSKEVKSKTEGETNKNAPKGNKAITVKGDQLQGKVCCLTGDFKYGSKAEVQSYIESLGGKVVGSISSKVNYLINNDVTSISAKNKAAQAANIPIISEEDYLKLRI